jgi:hypothetical protein
MEETLSGRRTLRVRGAGNGSCDISYELGITTPDAGDAALYLIDPSFHRCSDPATAELFELAPGSVV